MVFVATLVTVSHAGSLCPACRSYPVVSHTLERLRYDRSNKHFIYHDGNLRPPDPAKRHGTERLCVQTFYCGVQEWSTVFTVGNERFKVKI